MVPNSLGSTFMLTVNISFKPIQEVMER